MWPVLPEPVNDAVWVQINYPINIIMNEDDKKVTKSMKRKQISSWLDDNRSSDLEVFPPKLHYHSHESLLPHPILSLTNPPIVTIWDILDFRQRHSGWRSIIGHPRLFIQHALAATLQIWRPSTSRTRHAVIIRIHIVIRDVLSR
jgi:hypothetical protein